MLGRVDEVVMDCVNPHGLVAFWASVLGGEIHHRDPDWSYLCPPNWTQLSFQRAPEPKSKKNRVHIDVAVEDLAEATNQAVVLGARPVGTIQHSTGGSFQILLDPEGNEFCLVRAN